MIEDVLKKVESPFTDEMIQDLIKTFVLCGCDSNSSYNNVNNNNSTTKLGPEIIKMINNIEDGGISSSEAWQMDKTRIPYIIDTNNAWIIIKSDEDPYGEYRRTKNNKQPLVYRTYLNVKGKEKLDLVKEYISKCKDKNLPFKFKFSKDDDRDDQVIFLSNEEAFEEQLEIIEELSQGLELGQLPKLIGKYKDNIGVSEEYVYRLFSPTTAKLALIKSSIKKYLCDHREELCTKFSDEEIDIVDGFIKEFDASYEFQEEILERSGKKYIETRKSYYQKKDNMECAKEHIETNSDSYMSKNDLPQIGNAIIKLYEENPEVFLQEIKENFKDIAINVWGYSKDLVFSNDLLGFSVC